MAIKILLWDIDGTILNFEKAEEAAIRKGFEEHNLGICTDQMLADYKQINRGYWEALERGEMTKEQILIGRFVDFFAKYKLDTAKADAFNKGYQVNLGDTICFNDDAYDLLVKLNKKYKQYAVTNGTAVAQHRKIDRSGIGEVLEKCFISEEVGYEKPSEKFFEVVFEEIGAEVSGIVNREEVLIIGDSLTSDIKGGNNCGIKTCWYNPNHMINDMGLRVDYEIDNLGGILEVLMG